MLVTDGMRKKEGEDERKNPKSLASTIRKVVELFTFLKKKKEL